MEMFCFRVLVTAFAVISGCFAASFPRPISGGEFMDYFKNGSDLSYIVNIKNCKSYAWHDIPDNYVADDLNNAIITSDRPGTFTMYHGYEREIDGTPFNWTGTAIRYTLTQFYRNILSTGDSSTVAITVYKPYSGGTLRYWRFGCDMDKGNASGLTLIAQTPPGIPLQSFNEVKVALLSGEVLRYSLYVFFENPFSWNAHHHQLIAGRIEGYRFEDNGDIVFTPPHVTASVNIDSLVYFNVTLTSTGNVNIGKHCYYKRNKHFDGDHVKPGKFGETLNITKKQTQVTD